MNPLLERLLSKIRIDDGTKCWQWMAGMGANGYGQFWYDGMSRRAHRVSFELHHGPIPRGFCVCHRCDNRACVNPEHLFLGSHDENMIDMVTKGRQSRLNGRGLPQTKLSEEDVIAIRSATGLSCRTLAKQYGIGAMQISRIRSRQRWTHI